MFRGHDCSGDTHVPGTPYLTSRPWLPTRHRVSLFCFLGWCPRLIATRPEFGPVRKVAADGGVGPALAPNPIILVGCDAWPRTFPSTWDTTAKSAFYNRSTVA